MENFKFPKNLGGCDSTLKAAEENDLLQTIEQNTTKYDYDILVNWIQF